MKLRKRVGVLLAASLLTAGSVASVAMAAANVKSGDNSTYTKGSGASFAVVVESDSKVAGIKMDSKDVPADAFGLSIKETSETPTTPETTEVPATTEVPVYPTEVPETSEAPVYPTEVPETSEAPATTEDPATSGAPATTKLYINDSNLKAATADPAFTTEIKVNSVYMDQLTVGEHTMMVAFEDNTTVDVKFNVVDKSEVNQTKTVKTGDSSLLMVFAAAAILSGAVVVVAGKKRFS